MTTTVYGVAIPPKSMVEPSQLVDFYREETAKAIGEYNQLEGELLRINPFSDPSLEVELHALMAKSAERLADAATELLGWLDEQETNQ